MSEIDLESRIADVSAKFQAFIARQKSEIVNAREQYVHGVSQIQTECRELARHLKEAELKESELQHQVERELGDANGSQSRISELKAREKTLTGERGVLEKQVQELGSKVQLKREELSQLREHKQRQGELDVPETLVYEQLLGFKIEGLKDDVLKLVFNNVDQKDVKKEYTVMLNVSQHEYTVEGVDPQIAEEEMALMLEKFNESRDLAQFLKHVRRAFKQG